MDSTSFALSLRLRKCANIVRPFAELEKAEVVNLQKAGTRDYLETVRNHRQVFAERLSACFSEDTIVKSNEVVLTLEAFEKACKDLKLEVYTKEAINAYTKKIVGIMGRVNKASILEKAKSDLGSLKKVTILSKEGSKSVWVKSTSIAKADKS